MQRQRSLPQKQSAFVFAFCGDHLYAVKNRQGELGAPGGKRDPSDRTIFETAKREFGEETGAPLPVRKLLPHFEWGTPRHAIRIYYMTLGSDEAALLPVGATNDEAEEETLWAEWRTEDSRRRFRDHIAMGLVIYAAMIDATQTGH